MNENAFEQRDVSQPATVMIADKIMAVTMIMIVYERDWVTSA